MIENTDKRTRQYIVQINEDNMRLDEFLAYKIARFSRSRASACIKAGGVSIDPFRAPKPALKLHPGDIVSITQTLSGDFPMYEDVRLMDETDDFWVFDKPSGMAVHPTANIYHNTITRYIETQLHAQPYVVHRLDKETSGILIVAKSPEVSKQLDKLFLSHALEKCYEAIVYNAGSKYYPGAHESIDIPLGFAGLELPKITMGIGSLDAHTEVDCTDIHGDFARCSVQIHSGRQHQIRVHLALTGTPILGDKLYLFGEKFYKDWLDSKDVPIFSPPRHLLHACRLSFEWRGKCYAFQSPLPQIMDEIYRGQTIPSMFPTDYARLFVK